MEYVFKKIGSLLILITITVSCTGMKYQNDIGFLNSAQANSMEYFVRINDKPCVDMDEKVGLCAKRVKTNENLVFKMMAREYGYRFNLKCSSDIDSNLSVDIKKETPYSFQIDAEKFSHTRSFTCIGEVFPHDRKQEISASWHVRVLTVDKDYTEREKVQEIKSKGKTYLVMGKHARYVHHDGKIEKKKPVIEKGSGFAFSESEMMRFNYYGLKKD